MEKMRKKKLLSVLMAFCLALTLLPTFSLAAETTFSDMPSDSSAAALTAAVKNGLLQGKDGKIMPYDNLTRAQMATILVRAFGANGQADLSGFKDVSVSAWYYTSLAEAVQMKLFQGNNGYLTPNTPIKRQEAFTVLARAMKLADGTIEDLSTFSDAGQISSYAVGPLAALVKGGYLHGNNGKLSPQANITRGQFAIIMDNLFKTYITAAGTATSVNDGSVVVNVPDVTLKDLTITGNLIIGDGVGDGTVTLDNVTVQGTTVVRGGGVNSIIVKGGSSLGAVTVAKVDGNVRIHVEGNASIDVVYVDDGKNDVIVEGTVDKLVVATPDTPVVIQNATIGEVVVSAADANVTAGAGAVVATLTVNASATNTEIEVASGAKITTVNAAGAGASVSGEGTVATVNASGNNVSVTTSGTTVKAATGTTGVTAGSKEVSGGSTGTVSGSGGSSSGGSSGGGSTTVALTLAKENAETLLSSVAAAKEALETAQANGSKALSDLEAANAWLTQQGEEAGLIGNYEQLSTQVNSAVTKLSAQLAKATESIEKLDKISSDITTAKDYDNAGAINAAVNQATEGLEAVTPDTANLTAAVSQANQAIEAVNTAKPVEE